LLPATKTEKFSQTNASQLQKMKIIPDSFTLFSQGLGVWANEEALTPYVSPRPRTNVGDVRDLYDIASTKTLSVRSLHSLYTDTQSNYLHTDSNVLFSCNYFSMMS